MVEYLKGSESVFKTEPVNDARKLVAKTIDDIISCRNGKENCFDLRNAMQDIMMDDVGIFRNAKDLQNGVDRLLELSERAKHIGLHGSVKGFTPEAVHGPARARHDQAGALHRLRRASAHGIAWGAYPRGFPRAQRRRMADAYARLLEGRRLFATLKYEDASPWFELPPGERRLRQAGRSSPPRSPPTKIKTKEQAEEAIK